MAPTAKQTLTAGILMVSECNGMLQANNVGGNNQIYLYLATIIATILAIAISTYCISTFRSRCTGTNTTQSQQQNQKATAQIANYKINIIETTKKCRRGGSTNQGQRRWKKLRRARTGRGWLKKETKKGEKKPSNMNKTRLHSTRTSRTSAKATTAKVVMRKKCKKNKQQKTKNRNIKLAVKNAAATLLMFTIVSLTEGAENIKIVGGSTETAASSQDTTMQMAVKTIISIMIALALIVRVIFMLQGTKRQRDAAAWRSQTFQAGAKVQVLWTDDDGTDQWYNATITDSNNSSSGLAEQKYRITWEMDGSSSSAITHSRIRRSNMEEQHLALTVTPVIPCSSLEQANKRKKMPSEETDEANETPSTISEHADDSEEGSGREKSFKKAFIKGGCKSNDPLKETGKFKTITAAEGRRMRGEVFDLAEGEAIDLAETSEEESQGRNADEGGEENTLSPADDTEDDLNEQLLAEVNDKDEEQSLASEEGVTIGPAGITHSVANSTIGNNLNELGIRFPSSHIRPARKEEETESEAEEEEAEEKEKEEAGNEESNENEAAQSAFDSEGDPEDMYDDPEEMYDPNKNYYDPSYDPNYDPNYSSLQAEKDYGEVATGSHSAGGSTTTENNDTDSVATTLDMELIGWHDME